MLAKGAHQVVYIYFSLISNLHGECVCVERKDEVLPSIYVACAFSTSKKNIGKQVKYDVVLVEPGEG